MLPLLLQLAFKLFREDVVLEPQVLGSDFSRNFIDVDGMILLILADFLELLEIHVVVILGTKSILCLLSNLINSIAANAVPSYGCIGILLSIEGILIRILSFLQD
jgi:hypothetical protein